MAGDVGHLVNAWALGWSVLLTAGYLADLTAWSWMKALRDRGVFKVMLLSTGAVVLGLALAGVREQGAMLVAWAVISASLKLLCDSVVAAPE
jgi:hypothetical protein